MIGLEQLCSLKFSILSNKENDFNFEYLIYILY